MSEKSENRTIIYFVSAVILCTVLAGITVFYSSYLHETFEEETIEYLDEIANKSALALQNDIDGRLRYLSNIARNIGEKGFLSIKKDLNTLSHSVNDMQCKRLGIIFPDGAGYGTDGFRKSLKYQEYYKRGLAGETYISNTFYDKEEDERYNVCVTPIRYHDEIIGVLFATYLTESFQDILAVSTFGGDGYTYVVRKNGNAIVPSSNPTSFTNFKNVFRSMREANVENMEASLKMEEQLLKGKSGCIKFKNKIVKYMNYRPLEINDWFLLSVVPDSVINDKMQKVLVTTNLMFVFIMAIFLVLIITIFVMQKKNRKELIQLAFIDELTGLSNLNKFKKNVTLLLTQSKMQYAIIKFDVDEFKYINDLYGYNEGNKALIYIAKALKETLRYGETCARITGDQFVALCNYSSEDELVMRLERFANNVKEYNDVNVYSYELILSMGIYEISNKELDVNNMIDRASIPQISVKGNYRSCYAFYDAEDRKKHLFEKEIESKMKVALENEEFKVYYQPKYEISNAKLGGAEALVRWKQGDRIVPPNDFIPLFEKNGFVVNVDKYVFEQVCIKVREWLDAGIEPVPISVNVSRIHLHNPDFIYEYQEMLKRHNVPAKYIELEITESAMFEKMESMLEIMGKLHDMGFLLSMDDFGSGYSSLNMLKNIPVDIVKMDREFFTESLNNEKGKKIISLVVKLAKSMGMLIVAEGVETEEQLKFLQENECDLAQGYLFAKPMPVVEFEELLKNK